MPFISAYGSTETTGSITFTYFDADATGLIGLPVPGVEIKLSPSHGKLEVCVKGSVNVRLVLDTRASAVDSLYTPDASGILLI